MSYLEIKSGKCGNYVSFVKKIRFMGEEFVIKRHIGKELPTITSQKYIMDNIDPLTELEFGFRMKYVRQIAERFAYSEDLPARIEKKAIRMANLMEAKDSYEMIYSEFAKEFIFNSNNIEGSRIPREKVLEIIDKGESRYENRNEVREVLNSVRAFDYLRKGFKFNIPSIKRLYYILTDSLIMENGHSYPKGFKKIPNIVGNSATTPPDLVLGELESLLAWCRNSIRKVHPLILAFRFHRDYEHIHPFLDGNGRTGRLIMNKILLGAGYFPVIVFRENKLAYFNSLEKSSRGSEKKYYKFMLEQTDKTYDLILKMIGRY